MINPPATFERLSFSERQMATPAVPMAAIMDDMGTFTAESALTATITVMTTLTIDIRNLCMVASTCFRLSALPISFSTTRCTKKPQTSIRTAATMLGRRASTCERNFWDIFFTSLDIIAYL